MNKYVILVAGGTGTRMGSNLPKQFMLLRGKPVLYYTIRAFLDAYPDIEIILVLPAGFIDAGKEIRQTYFDKKNIRITTGGETRFHSVKKGLELVDEESIIFVHDGVRCLLSADLIHRCHDRAVASGSAIPVVASKDSVRIVAGKTNKAIDRSQVMLVQTPQAFQSNILIPAFATDFQETFTDEATVVEAYGQTVSLVEGEETNIKITRPADLLVAEKILEELGVGRD